MTIAARPAEALLRRRRLPIGAEVVSATETHFRVWAPKAQSVEVILDHDESVPLTRDDFGYFSGTVAAEKGVWYRYRIDGDQSLPDPASRFQPEGPHGPSQIIDPSNFSWSDSQWPGPNPNGNVIYEMHVGTFTRAGTWRAAAERLTDLADLGVTILEVMPVADFPGRFGWGYDGVNLFAPTRLYGAPDDFRAFVDWAHSLKMAVILDVVYNHFGAAGNYLRCFSDAYFTDRYKNEWGEAINFDGQDNGPVREFFLSNAAYWVDEFHIDGLRLDATQQIFDSSDEHIVQSIGQRVRAAASGRSTFIVAENEPQHSRLARSMENSGFGLDALWNDDFHHSAMVALTGKNAAYYSDYRGTPQELISALKWGFLFQGQRYAWQKKRRGTPCLDLAPSTFVTFLQNHDQIANSGLGLPPSMRTSPGRWRAMTALLLLGPGTPMLFQGQEYGSCRPFYYFADHEPELARMVAKGRRDFLSQFPDLGLPDTSDRLPEPSEAKTFADCRLDLDERNRNQSQWALHRDLLTLRRTDPTFGAARHRGMDGAVLSDQAFVLRFFGNDGDDRLLVVNLGRDMNLPSIAEPLMTPPEGKRWSLVWSSDDTAYGGTGTPPPEHEEGWHIPGEATIAMSPVSMGA